MPATQSRWTEHQRLIYQSTIINGTHTGKLLINLNFQQLQDLSRQATNSKDQAAIKAHLALRNGPQPGAPADQ